MYPARADCLKLLAWRRDIHILTFTKANTLPLNIIITSSLDMKIHSQPKLSSSCAPTSPRGLRNKFLKIHAMSSPCTTRGEP